MLKRLKKFGGIFLAAALTLPSVTSVYGAIPRAYWQYQQPFLDAAAAGNKEETVRLGMEISKLFVDAPMDADKAGILYSTYEKMYPCYEAMGNYDMAISCLKAMIPYGEYLGFDDGVKIAEARIRMIDPMTEVYALTQNTGTTPYYGMKNEPRNGAYFGRVAGKEADAPYSNESIVGFYVECLSENVADFDYLIRPYADGNRVIHIALNMPNENSTLQQVVQSSADAYLQSTMQYLNSLNCPVLLRIGGEMNVWTNLADPDLYKQAYIKIANIARAQAPNVALVFSPNVVSNWNVDISQYYPGDEYVDWVGVSLYYNQYRNPQNPVVGQDFEEMFYCNGKYANPITMLKDIVERYGSKKPIIITEGGSGHKIAGNSMDLSGFAKDKVNLLYSYVSMVYPQVKGLIYFDNVLPGSGRYIYGLNQSSAVKNQYLTSTQFNQALLNQVGDTSMAYVKAGNYQDNLGQIQLNTYCGVPGDVAITVTYTLDGAAVSALNQAPYTCTINAGGLTAGNHALKVEVKGQNGYHFTKDYTLTKGADGMVTIR